MELKKKKKVKVKKKKNKELENSVLDTVHAGHTQKEVKGSMHRPHTRGGQRGLMCRRAVVKIFI